MQACFISLLKQSKLSNLNINLSLHLEYYILSFCVTCLVLFNKCPQSLLIIRQAAMETQTLLCLSEPLQQYVNSRVKLLSLQRKHRLHQAHRLSLPSI